MLIFSKLFCRVSLGYITEAMLMAVVEQCMKDHPKVEIENLKQWQHYIWKELYNCGQDVPEGINISVIVHHMCVQ